MPDGVSETLADSMQPSLAKKLEALDWGLTESLWKQSCAAAGRDQKGALACVVATPGYAVKEPQLCMDKAV